VNADRSNTSRDGLARSIQVRLARHAKEIGADPNLVLTRYAVERFLYRLSRSPHVERFVLKGALLMLVWFGDTLRPTRDADLLGFGDLSDSELTNIFTDICNVEVEPDAMTYLVETVSVEPIRFEDSYGGKRITFAATLGTARLRVQVDVGIGDAVVPPPTWLDYPSLLDLPRPRLRAYSPATVIAEKLHAIAILGLRNSRMKDYFDLHTLAHNNVSDASVIAQAVAATFHRRKTALPTDWPLGLADEFAADATKRKQWKAFLDKNQLDAPSLEDVIEKVRRFLEVPLQHARQVQEAP
jgi:predicted nucleotidyltransferase component of viral defense system